MKMDSMCDSCRVPNTFVLLKCSRAANFNYQNYDKVVYDILTRAFGERTLRKNLAENLLIFKSLGQS